MSKTAISAGSVDTGLIVDKFAKALQEVYDIATNDIGDTNEEIYKVIEPVLEEYRSKYGKDARRSINRTED